MKYLLIGIFASLAFLSCNEEKKEVSAGEVKVIEDKTKETLPILGQSDEDENGNKIYHTIRDFKLVNQHKDTISQKDLDGKVYIADFFFTKCPVQCPLMTNALKRVQQNCKDIDFNIVSHTIDVRNDSSETFLKYIERFGLEDNNWYFLTGDFENIKNLGQKYYLVTTGVNDDASDVGDIHSPHLILIDKQKRIRGLYNGTEQKEVDKLMKDLRILVNE